MALKKLHLLLILLCMINCSTDIKLTRSDRPIEKSDTEVMEDTGLIRSFFCDIYLENISNQKWKYILKHSEFANNNSKDSIYKLDNLKFFHVIIKNTSQKPIKLTGISLKYKNYIRKPLIIDQTNGNLKSKYYLIFNFKKILSTHRMLGKEINIRKIKYNDDIINFKTDFIPPGDSVMKIIPFSYIPVKWRKYSIFFSLNYSGIKKSIAFDIIRDEYRENGKFFINKTIRSPLDED